MHYPDIKVWIFVLVTCRPADLPTRRPADLPTSRPAYQPTCLPAYMSTCLHVYLSTYLIFHLNRNYIIAENKFTYSYAFLLPGGEFCNRSGKTKMKLWKVPFFVTGFKYIYFCIFLGSSTTPNEENSIQNCLSHSGTQLYSCMKRDLTIGHIIITFVK